MALWRVTCPMEERYVIATTMTVAMALAESKWAPERAGKPEKYTLTRIDMVHPEDPWGK